MGWNNLKKLSLICVRLAQLCFEILLKIFKTLNICDQKMLNLIFINWLKIEPKKFLSMEEEVTFKHPTTLPHPFRPIYNLDQIFIIIKITSYWSLWSKIWQNVIYITLRSSWMDLEPRFRHFPSRSSRWRRWWRCGLHTQEAFRRKNALRSVTKFLEDMRPSFRKSIRNLRRQ